ncbi:MAG: response regulator [Proteobacteria bacterium]|nr:response regulator [Pseudomonadota bacterium]MBU4297477.1 response regulator [Pseudomonadota bacterium]MCG2749247.1 ATP-binding protein [Desulfobulbaceae bacterium]
MFRSIKTKILVSQIGLVLLVCGLLGFSSYVLMVDSLKKTQEQRLRNIAQDRAQELSAMIQYKEEKFRTLATNEAIEAYTREYHEPVLIQHFNGFMAEFPMLAYVREDGIEEMKLVNGVERPEILEDISTTFLFEEATWIPNKVFSVFPGQGTDAEEMMVQFAYCRQNFFEEFEGVIVGGIPLGDFLKDFQQFKFDDTGFLILMDAAGTIISHPQKDKIMGRLAGDNRQSEEIVTQAGKMNSGFHRASLLGVDGFVAYSPVPGGNWSVLAVLPYDKFMDAPNNLRNMVFVISLAVLIAAILLSLLLARGITKPILQLSRATSRLAQGDLQQTVDIRAKDEIGMLAESFNNMTRDLHDAIVLRDLETSERKWAEQERRKLEIQVQRAQRMEALGTLAGGVAHDLNNILGAIISYPELILLDLPADSRIRAPLLAIQQSGHKAAAIVQDLLTMARRGVVESTVMNLNQTVNEYLRSPEHESLRLRHPQVVFLTNLAQDLLDICGSPVHLSKTVMNLVFNAAEAMPDGGKIMISTRNRYVDKPIRGYDHVEEGEYVIFTVADTGIGISPQDLGRIFEPFYTKKVMGRSGTGLGMAVVWGTVKDHNGYIQVESVEGRGSTFTLYFPVTRQERAEEIHDLSLQDYMGNGESILVVDDIIEQRVLASEMLRKLGYSVNSVASGEEAIAYLQDHRADLLLLDMIMEPGIDGLETYKKILEMNPAQKAVIVSGFSETDRVMEAERLGVGAYVRKPFVLKKIGLAVKAELNSPCR